MKSGDGGQCCPSLCVCVSLCLASAPSSSELWSDLLLQCEVCLARGGGQVSDSGAQ